MLTKELVRAVKRALAVGSVAVEPTAELSQSFRRTRHRIASAVATTLIAASPGVFAQSNIDGYVYGTAPAGGESAITLENVAEAYQAFRRRDLVPEVTLLQVSRAEPLARYMRYEALNPIQIFAVTKTGVP